MRRVAPAIDSALADKNAVGRPSTRRWRASLLGSCLRQQFYAADKVPQTNPPDDRALRIFERGHLTAEVLNRYLARSKDVLLYTEEVHLEWDQYDFAVNVDAYVEWRDGTHEVLEFKSMNSKGFTYLRGEPKPEHAIQVAVGRLLMESALRYFDIGARVVYVSADDWRMEEFEIGREWDKKAVRILEALRYFDDGGRWTYPPRLRFKAGVDPRTKYPCSWCSWRDLCRPPEPMPVKESR